MRDPASQTRSSPGRTPPRRSPTPRFFYLSNLHLITTPVTTTPQVLMKPQILMEPARIRRTVNRMAHQMAEQSGDACITLIGVNRKGQALAGELQTQLAEIIGMSADILAVETDQTVAVDLSGVTGHIYLVDDVIFTGRTIYDVLGRVRLPADPTGSTLSICVLVDRGHRSTPLHAGIVGLSLPTKLAEHIQVSLDPTDGTLSQVVLTFGNP